MKDTRLHNFALFPLLLAATWLGAGSWAGCADLPPFDTPTKLQLIGGWSNVTIKLVRPGSSNPSVKCTVEEVLAQRAAYKVVPSPPSPYWDEFSVLAVHDPPTARNYIIAANHSFYAADRMGMTGYTIFTPGIYWSHSYVEVPEAKGDLKTAIAKFEKDFDGRKLNDGLRQERRDRVGLQQASPLFYFLETPVGGAKRVDMKVEAFDITDGILRLNVRNPATKAPATYWISPQSRKVIKSLVDGQEMDVNPVNQPWAEPVGK